MCVQDYSDEIVEEIKSIIAHVLQTVWSNQCKIIPL